MNTSVPQVWSINDQKYMFGVFVEKAFELYRLSGDIRPLDQAVRSARAFCDSEMKIAAHKGALDWEHVDKVSRAIERVEAFVRKRTVNQQIGKT